MQECGCEMRSCEGVRVLRCEGVRCEVVRV